LFVSGHNQTYNGSHRVAQARGDGRTADSHVQKADKYIVKHDVQYATCHGTNQGQGCFFRGDHIQSKIVHQQDWDCKEKIAAEIRGTIACDLRGQPHAPKNSFHQRVPKHRHDQANNHIH